MEFISINERAYKYIRQFTIKSVLDALVELITNSIDAYNKTSITDRYIWIEFTDNKIIVRDWALGLTSDGLHKCFLQVGNYTANESSRGFFSRGAKDISAIGNITFDTIKDNKYSQCFLNTDAYGSVTITDTEATPEIRNTIKIPDNYNGLQVTIDLLPNFYGQTFERLESSISKIAVLRDIMANNANIIHLTDINSGFTKRIKYLYPEDSKIILDLTYNVPNYTEYSARFVVYQITSPFEQPIRENEMEFGFIIKDSTSVYEVSTLDSKFRWNPYINYLYGFLYSDGIHELLLDYDNNGTSEKNPYPILDPSRVSGINKQHPFIISMLSLPLVRLDYILRQLNTSITNGLISIDDLNDIVSELEKLGLDVIQTNDISMNFTPSYDSKLIQAIQDERANFVQYETSYVMNEKYNTEEITIINYVKEELQKMNATPGSMFIMAGNDLVQIPNNQSSDINDPVNILSLIPPQYEKDVAKNPYIYVVSNTRDINGTNNVERLYIFNNGIIDLDYTIPITVPNKAFQIQFINDLNMQQRYNIDYSNGVIIQININNPLVYKYLVEQPTQTTSNTKALLMQNQLSRDISESAPQQNISLSSYNSTQSLMFFKEMFTDILTHLMIDNDIKNGKLILDEDSYNNSQRLINYKNKIMTTIEIEIDNLFRIFINKNINNKFSQIDEIIQNISQSVGNMVEIPPELYTMTYEFKNLIIALLE